VAHGVPGRLRPRIFLTFRHYKGGRSSAKRTGRLYPTRNPWYSLSEAESTSGHMFLSGVPRKKSPVTPSGIDPGTVRLVAQRLNHYATLGPHPQPSIDLILHHQREVLCTNKSGLEKKEIFSFKMLRISTHTINKTSTKLLGNKTSVLCQPVSRVAQSKDYLAPFLNRRSEGQPVDGTFYLPKS